MELSAQPLWFLQTLHERMMDQLGLYYLGYMDAIVVLAPSRWKLRRAVRVVNQTLNGLGLEKQPEKTFIGRIEKGYHFRPGRLAVAQKTVERFGERARRLYEQGPGGGLASARLGRYVQRWFRWAASA